MYPHQPHRLTEGYAVGEQIPAGSPYLTVLGSAYYGHDCIMPTREQAQAWLDARPTLQTSPHYEVQVRRVRRGPTTDGFLLID